MRQVRWTLLLLVGLLSLAACGAGQAPATVVPALNVGLLSEVAGGELDGQIITVQGIYYERGGSRLLVPALSFMAPGGPVPLLTSPAEAVVVDRRPEGELLEAQGISYGPARITGRVVAGESGRMLEVQHSKVINPRSVSLQALVAGGFEGVVVEVEGTLLARPGSLLLVSAVGPGGVPESGAAQAKVVAPVPDEPLLGRLQGSPEGQVRYGAVRAVGLWSGNALHLLWAELR